MKSKLIILFFNLLLLGATPLEEVKSHRSATNDEKKIEFWRAYDKLSVDERLFLDHLFEDRLISRELFVKFILEMSPEQRAKAMEDVEKQGVNPMEALLQAQKS